MTLYKATLGPWTRPVEAPSVGRAAQLAPDLFDAAIRESFFAGKLPLKVEPEGATGYPALLCSEWLKVFRQSVKGKCPWKVR